MVRTVIVVSVVPDIIENGPVLVGTSRKSFVGRITGRPVEQRLAGSLASMAAAVICGAALVRVHDVPESVDCLRTLQAVREGECS